VGPGPPAEKKGALKGKMEGKTVKEKGNVRTGDKRGYRHVSRGFPGKVEPEGNGAGRLRQSVALQSAVWRKVECQGRGPGKALVYGEIRQSRR